MKKENYYLDELQEKIEKLIPEAVFDFDNFGQVIIYTGLFPINDDEDNIILTSNPPLPLSKASDDDDDHDDERK